MQVSRKKRREDPRRQKVAVLKEVVAMEVAEEVVETGTVEVIAEVAVKRKGYLCAHFFQKVGLER
jgi:hypothetical protein